MQFQQGHPGSDNGNSADASIATLSQKAAGVRQWQPQLIVGRIAFVDSDNPLQSIITGTPSVSYHIKLQEYVKRRVESGLPVDSYEWIQRSGEHRAVDFWLVDPEHTDKRLCVAAASHLSLYKIPALEPPSIASESTLDSYQLNGESETTTDISGSKPKVKTAKAPGAPTQDSKVTKDSYPRVNEFLARHDAYASNRRHKTNSLISEYFS